MGINYKTKLIQPEMCRYMTVTECQEADKSMRNHAESQKQLNKQLQINPNLGTVK